MPTSRHPQKRCPSSPGRARPHPLVAPGDPPRRHTPRPAAHPARPHHRLVMLATRPPSRCTTFASEATNATVMLGNNEAFLARRVVMTVNPSLSIPNALRTRPDDYYRNAITV